MNPFSRLALCAFAAAATGCEGCSEIVDVKLAGEDGPSANFVCLSQGGVNSYTCQCVCLPGDGTTDPIFGPKNINACLPDEFNECKGGTAPDDAQRATDCSERVAPTVQGMVRLVNGDAAATCTCTDLNGAGFVTACNRDCTEVVMPADATGFFDASFNAYTNVEGDAPVCARSAIDPPPVEGIAGSLFPARTNCDVAGLASMVSADLGCPADTPCQLATSGTAGFVGPACPGGGCNVDLGLSLDVQDFTIEIDCSVLGFGDFCENIDVSDIGVTATSMLAGGAAVDASGNGAFAAGQIELAVRSAEDGDISVAETTNGTPTQFTVDWAGKTCAVHQELPDVLVTNGDDSVTLAVTIDIQGTLSNQPPTAEAGSDVAIECTSPEGAEVVLDASASEDPDDNITWYTWRAGLGFGDPVLSSGSDPSVTVTQPLGAALYALRVFDAFSVASLDTKIVTVVDSSPPVFDGVTLEQSCLWPPNHKYVRFALGEQVQVDAQDACDEQPVIAVTNVVSSQPDNGVGDGDTTNDMLFGPGGFCLRAERAGGTTRTYTVTLSATDGAGNVASEQVIVRVPGDGSECDAAPSAFISDEDAPTDCSFP